MHPDLWKLCQVSQSQFIFEKHFLFLYSMCYRYASHLRLSPGKRQYSLNLKFFPLLNIQERIEETEEWSLTGNSLCRTVSYSLKFPIRSHNIIFYVLTLLLQCSFLFTLLGYLFLPFLFCPSIFPSKSRQCPNRIYWGRLPFCCSHGNEALAGVGTTVM